MHRTLEGGLPANEAGAPGSLGAAVLALLTSRGGGLGVHFGGIGAVAVPMHSRHPMMKKMMGGAGP